MSYFNRDLICKCGGEMLSGLCVIKCGACGRFWLDVQEWMLPDFRPIEREFTPAQLEIIHDSEKDAASERHESCDGAPDGGHGEECRAQD